jgi:hypothetical protein
MEAEFSFYNPKNSYQAIHNQISEDVDLLILNYYNLSYTNLNQTVSIIPYQYHYVCIYLNFFFISSFDGNALLIIHIGLNILLKYLYKFKLHFDFRNT